MQPIEFKEHTKTLTSPDSQPNIGPLHVWTDGQECVSCWKMSWKERISALLFGKVWICILSGQTQPPIQAFSIKELFHLYIAEPVTPEPVTPEPVTPEPSEVDKIAKQVGEEVSAIIAKEQATNDN